MKELTQTEAFNFFKGKKTMLQDWEQSRNVQKKLFSAGFEWEDEGKELSCTDMPFLFFGEDGIIGYASAQDYEYFSASKNEFISPFDILSTSIVEEPEFTRGQEVIVRTDVSNWAPAQFGYYAGHGDMYPYVVYGGAKFVYCLPLEGNENLIGTSNMDKYIS